MSDPKGHGERIVSDGGADGWSLGGDHFEIDGVEFRLGYFGGSSSSRFSLIKPLALIERYRALDPPITGSRIFELGIAEGGSTAWMAVEHRPELVVSVDLAADRVVALDDLIRDRQLGSVLRPHYGVDQSERDRLLEIARAELGGHPLDLVFDDASHRYEPTKASFEALFPLLRPGGLYVIEDWSWQIREAAMWRAYFSDSSAPDAAERLALLEQQMHDPQLWEERARCMSRLVIELHELCVLAGDLVAEISVNEHWFTVRRGPAPIDPATFSLDDIGQDVLGLLPDAPPFPS